MKPIGESFGFSTLITVFLPGLTLAIGIGYVFHENPDWLENARKPAIDVFDYMKDNEWQLTFASLAVISLLGSVTAAINGFLESWIYDCVTRCRHGLKPDTYVRQWYEYLYQLGMVHNDYISRVVTWFLFESRMAVALLIVFGLHWLADGGFVGSVQWPLLIAVGLFSVLGAHHHHELAGFRKYWYSAWKKLREMAVDGGAE